MSVWISHSFLFLSFFFFLYVCVWQNSLNLWEWLYLWSCCGKHVRLLPFPLSSSALKPYRLGRTVFVDSTHAHLILRWSPRPEMPDSVFGVQAIFHNFLGCHFPECEAWSWNSPCLLTILYNVFQSFLTGESISGVPDQFGYYSHALVYKVLSSSILVVLIPLLTHPRFTPPMSIAFPVFHNFIMGWGAGFHCWCCCCFTEVCFDLFHFIANL